MEQKKGNSNKKSLIIILGIIAAIVVFFIARAIYVNAVVDHAYDPTYGARPLKRYIQKHVETLSARLILEDRVKPHDVITFDVSDGELRADVK
jgi:ATP-dependent Clp protease ATP-binding subunit ClpA